MSDQEESYEDLEEEHSPTVFRHVLETAHEMYTVECEVFESIVEDPTSIKETIPTLPSRMWLHVDCDTKHLYVSKNNQSLFESHLYVALGLFKMDLTDWMGHLIKGRPTIVSVYFTFPELFTPEFLERITEHYKTNCSYIVPSTQFGVTCNEYSQFLCMPRPFTCAEKLQCSFLAVPSLTVRLNLVYKGDVKVIQDKLLENIDDEVRCFRTAD